MELGVICEALEMDIDFMKDIAKGERVGDEKKRPEDRVYYYYCYYLYSKHAIVSHEYKHSSGGSVSSET